MLALRIEIYHPLVGNDVVVERTDDERVTALCNVYRQFAHGLTAQYILFPSFRTELFLQRIYTVGSPPSILTL